MIIVAGGDSFTWGSELADSVVQPGVWEPVRHSFKTFPALLASDYGEYICTAWPGYGNDAIARTVISQCEIQIPDIVVVTWTFPGRYEFRFGYDTKQRKSPWYSITPWTSGLTDISKEFHSQNKYTEEQFFKTIERARNSGVAEFAEVFYRHVGATEYWEVYSSLREIAYLQNYLTVKNIPYLFMCADNSIRYNHTIEHADADIKSLYNQINWNKWFWWPVGDAPHETQGPRGFYQWAVENKYSMGTTHPLEDAHQAAAELIKEKFHEVVQKSIQ